jgi:membrane-bound lytic murein transglycosylase B
VWDGELTWRKLSVTGALILALALAAAIAGAFVVPALAHPLPRKANEAAPAASGLDPNASAGPAMPASASASPSPTVTPRPFAEWARPLAAKLAIPQVALESYGYAEWVLQQTRPTCKLQWTTLAAIGKLTTDHGRLGGSSLDAQGRQRPPRIGPALNGSGQPKVADTDGGALDGDVTWDHAVGPMQMLPSMWRASGVDGDSDGLADPQDVDDAALSAGYYLCSGGKDLTVVANWKAAVTGYHGMAAQIDKVFEVAQDYGVRSRA